MSNFEIGTNVKDFKFTDQSGEEISLHELRGKKVLLSFHPLAWTSVCTDQMRDLERNYDRFTEKNVVPIGVSIDPSPSKSAWAKVLCLSKLQLVSDFNPFAALTNYLDIYREDLNSSERANFLIDEDGNLIWKKVYEISDLPDLEEVFEVLK